MDFSIHTATSFLIPFFRSIQTALDGVALPSSSSRFPLTPTLSTLFASWHLSSTSIPLFFNPPFSNSPCSYPSSAILSPTPVYPQQPPPMTFTHSCFNTPFAPFNGISAATRKNPSALHLLTTFPPSPLMTITNCFLSPLTSFPLSSAPRSDPDFCIPNTSFRFAFSCKVRIPLFFPAFPSHSQCKCGGLIDPLW